MEQMSPCQSENRFLIESCRDFFSYVVGKPTILILSVTYSLFADVMAANLRFMVTICRSNNVWLSPSNVKLNFSTLCAKFKGAF